MCKNDYFIVGDKTAALLDSKDCQIAEVITLKLQFFCQLLLRQLCLFAQHPNGGANDIFCFSVPVYFHIDPCPKYFIRIIWQKGNIFILILDQLIDKILLKMKFFGEMQGMIRYKRRVRGECHGADYGGL